MSKAMDAVNQEAGAWIDANPTAAEEALFLLNSILHSRLADELRDRSGGTPPYSKGAVVLKLYGLPLFPDDDVPKGELHVRSNAGKLLAKITGLES